MKSHDGSRKYFQQCPYDISRFVAFEVLYDEDKNPGKGKQGSGSEEGRKGDNYFNSIVKELSIEETKNYANQLCQFSTYPELYRIRYNSKTGPLWEQSDSSERKIGSDHQIFGHWRNNVERAGQTASTPIQHSEHSREQKKC